MNINKIKLSFLILLFSVDLFGLELYETHRSVRAAGMGNAYVSVVNDSESLFYNPAGLARNTGFFWTIADPNLGVSGLDTLSQASDIQDASSFGPTLNKIYGETVWAGGGAKMAMLVPFFGIAVFDNFDARVLLEDPISPVMNLNYINDYGVAVGAGFNFTPFTQVGLVAKRTVRVGSRSPFGASTLGTLEPDNIFDNLEKTGVGFSFDMGVNFGFESIVSPALSFVWRNIGGTKFRPGNASDPAPPDDEEEWIVGASITVDTPILTIVPSMDVKHLENNDEALGKKLHLGIEFDFPIIDVRAGLNQGYYSLGASVSLGIIKVDVATFGVELGEYPGQLEDRRYMLQATIELGFDPNIGGFGLFGGGSGSSSSKSGGRARRLKQRR